MPNQSGPFYGAVGASASGSMTMGDSTQNASCTITSPNSVSRSGMGTTQLSKVVTLSGESGTITLHYVGNLNTSANSAVAGEFTFQRFPPPGDSLIKLTLCVFGPGTIQPDGIAIDAAHVAARGRWKPKGGGNDTYRADLQYYTAGGPVTQTTTANPNPLQQNPNIFYDWTLPPVVVFFLANTDDAWGVVRALLMMKSGNTWVQMGLDQLFAERANP
jgi:hypothetical protein